MSKNFGCNSCGLRSFGKRGNPQAAKAMRLMRSEGISLKEAWKVVKGGKASGRKKSRRTRRRGSKRASKRASKRGRRRSRRGKRRSRRSKSHRSRRRRRSRRFGSGPGFEAQTSYPNAYAPYFGASEPFVNPSEFFLPQTNGQIQSPQMLMTRPLAGYSGPGN